MKRINNNGKYRNNNNGYNPNYSLSYRFDSNSPAGKISGTALDLIKKYNELAKDAFSNGDYITSEIFRQYAEHYRKIVTDINERRNYNYQNRYDRFNNNQPPEEPAESCVETPEQRESGNISALAPAEDNAQPVVEKREFKVIEIDDTLDMPKPKRTYRRRESAI